MPLLTVTGSGSEEPLEESLRFLQGLSTSLQTRASAAGARAYLGTIRREAMSSSPGGPFETAAGYRMGVRVQGGGITGFLYSAGYGNTIEAGAEAHYVPLASSVNAGGDVLPGLGAWLALVHPELLERWGPTARFAKVKARGPEPWVLPAADRAQSAGADAFDDAMLNTIEKEVT